MSIKHHFVRLAEKITGRKCCRCIFNTCGQCNHPDGDMFMRCYHSMTRPGFFEDPEKARNAAAASENWHQAPGDMTEEEKHQLGKIVESLQEASATAQDAGLLGEDDQETDTTRQMRANLAARNVWEDKTESGLLEDF